MCRAPSRRPEDGGGGKAALDGADGAGVLVRFVPAMSSVFTDECFFAAMGHLKSRKITIFERKRKITIDKPSGDVTALP